jgi:uncharacterized surface protein with fasciclin (FAS1) repeats
MTDSATRTRTHLQRFFALMSLLALLLLSGTLVNAQDETITDIATDTDDLSILVDALQTTEFADTLAGDAPYTVFAPTNTAFQNALSDLDLTAEELLADTETLRSILTYHVVEGAVFSDELSDGAVTTLNGADVTVSLDEGVMINNATVTMPDIEAANGVIHVIDSVLIPPEMMQQDTGVPADDNIDPVSFVRLAHFSPDAPAVDVYIDGDVAVQALGYPNVTDFVELPAGAYEIAVAPAGTSADDAVIGPEEYAFAAETFATVAAVGSADDGTLAPAIFTEEFVRPLETGETRLTLFHAIEGAPAVDVYADETRIAQNLTYPETEILDDDSSAFTIDVPADTYSLSITEAGNADNVLLAVDDVELAANTFYLAAAIGTPDEPDVALIARPAEGTADDDSGEMNEPDDTTGTPGTIVDVVQTTEGFAILLDAIQAGGLTEPLEAEGPYTVFAPTDEAFENALGELGITASDLLNNPDLLNTLLTYHVVQGEYTLDALIETNTLQTIQSEEINIEITSDGFVLNGAVNIVTPDVEAENGVIHIVDEVLLPPSMMGADEN